MGFPKERVRNIIPTSSAKNSDAKMIARCIKGGYVENDDEFSDKLNKKEIIKLKKKFITMDTLYNCVKGKKNKGISKIKPESIDRNSFQNLVYFL